MEDKDMFVTAAPDDYKPPYVPTTACTAIESTKLSL